VTGVRKTGLKPGSKSLGDEKALSLFASALANNTWIFT